MGQALRQALLAVLPGGRSPTKANLEDVSEQLFGPLAGDTQVVTRAALYRHLVRNSETGFPGRALDKLLEKAGVTGNSDLTREDFRKFMLCVMGLLRNEQKMETDFKGTIPDNHVVRGSSKLNQLSQTNAFAMRVVRRSSMKRLWQLFQELDGDGDGTVSLPEFKKYMSRNRPDISNMSTSIFYSLDKRKEGLLSFRAIIQRLYPEATQYDMQQLMRMACPKDFQPHQRPDEKMMEEVKSVFQVFDDNHSGSLDSEEFVHAMALLGYSPEEAHNMLKAIDKHGQGEVSYDDFEAWYVDNHESLKAKLQPTADD